MRYSVLAAVAVLALTGCNTYYQKSFQKIMVRTPGAENAQCILSNKDNKYRVLPPREVLVERSRFPLTVICEKDGYKAASVTVQAHVYANAASMNVFNGVIPGVAYDVASDSIYEYPDLIIVNMTPAPNTVPLEPRPAPEAVPLRNVPVTPAPVETAPTDPAGAEKSISKSLRK